ncbi:MAG: TM2 domain-containing protein, partial [Pygmaiobacter sp.]
FCVNCGAPQSAQASPRAGQYRAAPPLRKSKLAAVLLAFFLGGFGIHNFYLGYTEKGLWQLVLGVLCCGTVSWIWAVVDAIMILCGTIYTDASGMPLGD